MNENSVIQWLRGTSPKQKALWIALSVAILILCIPCLITVFYYIKASYEVQWLDSVLSFFDTWRIRARRIPPDITLPITQFIPIFLGIVSSQDPVDNARTIPRWMHLYLSCLMAVVAVLGIFGTMVIETEPARKAIIAVDFPGGAPLMDFIATGNEYALRLSLSYWFARLGLSFLVARKSQE